MDFVVVRARINRSGAMRKTAARRAHEHRNNCRQAHSTVTKAMVLQARREESAEISVHELKARVQFVPITLVDVCCSLHSATAKSVVKLNGAALRVTWLQR